MKAVIIGAGRGSRLMPSTKDTPKCLAQVKGKRILDWVTDAFYENGIDQIAFIGGYQIEKVKADYPQFTFYHNAEWPHNNILASLMYAEAEMDGPFICSYSDILFTPAVIETLLGSDRDITVVCDTAWQERYATRTEHPSHDAEKMMVANGWVTRIHRDIPEADAYGEYIGVTKFSETGAARLKTAYHKAREQFKGQPYREARTFEKAYLIHLYQDMIEQGIRFSHSDTHGDYIEIDTQQDFEYARQNWSQ